MMNRIIFNEKLSFPCPEGFREMTKGEAGRTFGDTQTPRLCLWHEGLDIAVSLSLRKVNLLLAALTDPKVSLRGAEAALRRQLREQDYRRLSLFERPIAGQNARGFSYTCKRAGLVEAGALYLLRQKNCFYTLHICAPVPLEGERQQMAEELLNNIQFTD